MFRLSIVEYLADRSTLEHESPLVEFLESFLFGSIRNISRATKKIFTGDSMRGHPGLAKRVGGHLKCLN